MNENIMYLSQTHCHNHKVCEDTDYDIACCSRPAPSLPSNNANILDYDKLSAVQIEVFLRRIDKHQNKPVLNAGEISKLLMNHTLFSILTVNECIVLDVQNVDLVCRVSRVQVIKNTSDPILVVLENEMERDGESTRMASDVALDEPYRGRVTITTDFLIQSSNPDALIIQSERILPEGDLPEDVIHVTTIDGEWFPVRKMLLAPCIHLTKYVQAGHGKYQHVESIPMSERSPDAPKTGLHCKVDIDCCTFDRVLVFIMSQLYPKEYKFVLELSEMSAMLKAADTLGLMSLRDYCNSQLSSFESRVRKDKYIPLSEVKSRNNTNNELLIILDGMVLDITRWIDEHPGGASIIPAQALNIECSHFFEMYHVSRQSFLYLKSFYIGELSPSDREELRREGGDAKASVGFLQSLQSFTESWRVKVEEVAKKQIHKSL
jgi:cytochrome b involved in lipid metabolism